MVTLRPRSSRRRCRVQTQRFVRGKADLLGERIVVVEILRSRQYLNEGASSLSRFEDKPSEIFLKLAIDPTGRRLDPPEPFFDDRRCGSELTCPVAVAAVLEATLSTDLAGAEARDAFTWRFVRHEVI